MVDVLFLVSMACGAAAAERNAPPAPPELSQGQQAYLLTLARQTMLRQGKMDGADGDASMASGLAGHSNAVGVFVRKMGILIGEGFAEEAPLPAAVMAAAKKAGLRTRPSSDRPVGTWLTADELGAARVEVEVYGASQQIGGAIEPGGKISDLLPELLEPAMDGLGVVFDNETFRRPPSWVIATNAYYDAQKGAAFDWRDLSVWKLERFQNAVRLFRFRSLHMIEAEPGGRPMVLVRGLAPVRQEDVTREAVSAAIDRIGQYMLGRQNRDGTFKYEYLPSGGVYREELREVSNWTAQAEAAWAMSLLARGEKREAYEAAALKTIAAMERYRKPLAKAAEVPSGRRDLPGAEEVPAGRRDLLGGFLDTPDGRGVLGPPAAIVLAIADLPELRPEVREALGEGLEKLRDELAAGLAAMMDAGGRFRTAYPGFRQERSQQYDYPGQALLALARVYEITKDQGTRETMERGLGYYWDFYRGELHPTAIPYFSQALTRAWRMTGNEIYVGQAFLLNDQLIAQGRLIGPDNCPFPDLYGGIAPLVPGRAGSSTAYFLEGLADAYEAARTLVGQMEKRLAGRNKMKPDERKAFLGQLDEQRRRCEQYRQALLAGARFILQLQVRPEETWYMPFPQEAVDGIRWTLSENNIRIDSCQHAAASLMKIREALWPQRRDSASGKKTRGPSKR